MATPISTSASMNLYISLTDHVVRTGILKYYDPLMFSNLSLKTLAALSTINHTLPSGSTLLIDQPEDLERLFFDISACSNNTLYFYGKDHVVRTGILKYYDSLMFSNLSLKILSDLNVVNHTLPSGSPSSGILPEGINFITFDLIIESGV